MRMNPQVVAMRALLGVGLMALGILTSACATDSIEIPQRGLPVLTVTAASASLVAAGDSVLSSLTIKNTSATTQTVQFAPCTYLGPLQLLAYAPSSSKRSWDSALSVNGPCFTAIEKLDLAPGASHTFQQVNDVNEILGDSLPSGSYVFDVGGSYLTPTAARWQGVATRTLTKHAVPPAKWSFTTDKSVYLATASGSTQPIFYSFSIITRYTNNDTVPVFLGHVGQFVSWNIVGAGNNVGVAMYDPQSLDAVPTPIVTVAPGAARVDTIQFTGPHFAGADGTPFGTPYGQFRILFRAGAGCPNYSAPCIRQASTVFAVQTPQ